MQMSRRLRFFATHLLPCLLLATLSVSVQATSPRPTAEPDDPLFTDQWNLFDSGATNQATASDINATLAWDVTTGTRDTIIAILDSGVDMDHPDLISKIWVNQDEIPGNDEDDDNNGKVDDVNGWDFANQDDWPQDDTGWGTFMAGIAGAATDNGIGIAGIAWNNPIMPVRVLTRNSVGQATARIDDIVNGIRYAVDNGARVIHLGFFIEEPFLTPDQKTRLEATVNEAHNAGALLVAPVGDRGLAGNPTVYPAALSAVIGVTATDRSRERLSAAGHGWFIELAAPGVNLLGPLPDGRYEPGGTGTEFAAAHVSGVAALIWAVNPSLTPDQVRDIMRDTADDLGTVGYDEFYGFGLLNAALALQTTPHDLRISPHELHFQVDEFGVISPPTQAIINPNTSGLTWQARTNAKWLIIEGLTGKTPSSLTVSVDTSTIPNCDRYTSQILVESNQQNVGNGTQTVEVTLEFAQARCDQVLLPLIKR